MMSIIGNRIIFSTVFSQCNVSPAKEMGHSRKKICPDLPYVIPTKSCAFNIHLTSFIVSFLMKSRPLQLSHGENWKLNDS